MKNHSLLEVRTGRDSQKNANVMMELFSTLPSFRDDFWSKLLGQGETLSFEIVLHHQNINFYLYVPDRLIEYLKSAIGAQYPEATVKICSPDTDPLLYFHPQAQPNYHADNLQLLTTSLALENTECYPLKDYREFGETDSLAPLLSHLSKATANDHAVIQLIVGHTNERWKTKYENLIYQSQSADSSTNSIQTPSANKSLIESKIHAKTLRVNLNVALATPDKAASELFLDGILDAFGAFAKPESNALKRSVSLLPSNFSLGAILDRRLRSSRSFHLSVFELASLFHFPNQLLSTIPNLTWGKNLLGEPPENLPIVRKEYDDEVKREINVFAEAVFKNEVQKYGIHRVDRRRHMYVIGKTGTGKSTMLANMAINDLRNNEGLCFIDPHGDAIDILLDYIPASRINDVVYFNPADGDRTVKINLFEGRNIEHRELIASGIISIFHKLYEYSWGPRLEHFLRNALLTLLQMENAKLGDIVTLFTDKEFRKRTLAQLDDPVLKNFWLGEFEPLQDRMKNEAVAPILNKIGQFVSSPLVRNVVNADKSSFSIEQIMDEGKILLVNLSQGMLGEDNATLLGAMLITKIQLAAMGRVNIPEEQRRDFYLYVDEFQNFATTSFNKILSEARKYRLNLILANQYIAQIPEEVQKAIFGNCGSMVSFVMGSEDAEVFSREYGGKYTTDDLVSLNRHQIINRITIDNIISYPFPAYTLPLAKSSNHNRDKVIRVSRERYATKKNL
ncbi:type IV secretion system DNA-binding domain-containing protein [bacterium]|nr:type IV secretion system DNA-binding domain-containing protein [bacterium]